MRQLRFALLVFLLVQATAPGAWAHARLVRSEPKAGAELSRAPAQVDLWFNELLEDGFNTVTVFPAAELIAEKKANFVKGKPAVDSKDRTHLTIKLQSIPPGEYIIEWRVLSRDGHSAPGRARFTVRGS